MRDQQFYGYRPQPVPCTPTNYYPTLPTQPYMVPAQPFYSNPVREYSVSNQAMTFNTGSPYGYYQYPVQVQPQQQTPVYSFPSQPIYNPYFVSNGLQYWAGGPYSQPTVR